MATDMMTEAALAESEAMQAATRDYIRARHMEKLWGEDKSALGRMLQDKLGVLGLNEFCTAAGKVCVIVPQGQVDYKAAFEELEHVWHAAGHSESLDLEAFRKPGTPRIDVREARDAPPVIERARREGALEALEKAIRRSGDDERLHTDTLVDVADEYGGFEDEGDAE